MSEYKAMKETELEALKTELEAKYADFKAQGLKLDMSRGKPGAEQLDISSGILDVITSDGNMRSADGTDCRNYGVFNGLSECRELFSELLEVSAENIIIGGNSSLSLMFDYISQCMTHGADGTPWAKQDGLKFLCPVPGYDRHFTICEHFGIEMINVPMVGSDPDISVIEEAVKDSSVKGMFCVPKYSNPQGVTFSDEFVRRLAALKPAAKDFRVIWDNAYFVHDLTENSDVLLNIFPELHKHGNDDMVIEVASTSKISFPGGGVAVIAASDANIAAIKKRLFVQTICHDKINQLRHVRFFRNAEGVHEHMMRHAAILAPKFNAVLDAFDTELARTGVARWSRPNGGYFISLDVPNGCAKRVVALCREAGVVLTPAGATFPYGNDPHDSNIRIAPTFPSVAELEKAVELLCLCVRLAAVERYLSK